MNKELIIITHQTEIDIIFLEDKKIVEIHKDKKDNNFTVGDIYLGKVKKLIPGLNAAFVDVGYEKNAFLHYLDLGPQVNSQIRITKNALNGHIEQASLETFNKEKDIDKLGKISNVLHTNQPLLVQIVKEPISTKGPRLTSELSFPGRYCVLVPFSDKVSVSQKIKDAEERSRLKKLALSLKPKNFGIIIRTLAETKTASDLDVDIRELHGKWEKMIKSLSKAKAPQKVLGELDRTSTILRDILNNSFNAIYVDDSAFYEYTRNFIKGIAPEKLDIVKFYKNKTPILEYFGIEKQIKGSFGKTVSLKNGAYLVIEHTEALHVIDVNSGQRFKTDQSQENNALDVNLEAAVEVARQIRLRDLGGIIVIDFIDMRNPVNKKTLFYKLIEVMSSDRAKHTILPLNKFGLIHITRQRVRSEMNIDTVEKCPVCDGSGQSRSSIVFIDEIESNIEYLVKEQNSKYLKMTIHPYLYAYITKGILSIQLKWFFKFKMWIKIYPMSSHHYFEYHFYNKNDEEIKL